MAFMLNLLKSNDGNAKLYTKFRDEYNLLTSINLCLATN